MSNVLRLDIPRELASPNTWNGRHWRYKHRISQEWEKEIAYGVAAVMKPRDFVDALAAMNGPKFCGLTVGKMRVTVERYVPSARNFIRDDDNLRYSTKPVNDALKRQGYIKDDSRKWLEQPMPTQHVSEDRKSYRTVIYIEPIPSAEGDSQPTKRARSTNAVRLSKGFAHRDHSRI